MTRLSGTASTPSHAELRLCVHDGAEARRRHDDLLDLYELDRQRAAVLGGPLLRRPPTGAWAVCPYGDRAMAAAWREGWERGHRATRAGSTSSAQDVVDQINSLSARRARVVA